MCAHPASALAFAALALALAAPLGGCARGAAPSPEASSPPAAALGPDGAPLAEGSALHEAHLPDPDPSRDPSAEASSPGPDRGGGAHAARALIRPIGGGRVGGEVRLEAYPEGVRVVISLSGLGARGEHGLHVLDARSCRGLAPDAPLLGARAGRHGGPYGAAARRAAGALGNVRADGGRGRYDRIDPVLALDGPRGALGHAVVVREGLDDGVTPPDGGSGAVIGCGVLEAER